MIVGVESGDHLVGSGFFFADVHHYSSGCVGADVEDLLLSDDPFPFLGDCFQFAKDVVQVPFVGSSEYVVGGTVLVFNLEFDSFVDRIFGVDRSGAGYSQ